MQPVSPWAVMKPLGTPLSSSVKGNDNIYLARLGLLGLNETKCVKLPGTQ